MLNRAVWDARAAACLLLGLLIAAFAPSGPVLLGIDDTIERPIDACGDSDQVAGPSVYVQARVGVAGRQRPLHLIAKPGNLARGAAMTACQPHQSCN